MPVRFSTIGGSQGRATGGPYIQLIFTRKVIKTNDWYYKPHSNATWARKSKSSGTGNAQKIGINRT